MKQLLFKTPAKQTLAKKQPSLIWGKTMEMPTPPLYEMVYALYGLTPEEIKIVEGKKKRNG